MCGCGGHLRDELDLAAHELVDRFRASSKTVAFAESLTAGLTSSAVGGVPGASLVLRGGAVTYVNEVKERVLGVEAATIAAYSEVSHETAREMAVGALGLFGSTCAVSLTGYAGPGGGSASDPVGTVYIGYASEGFVTSERFVFSGDRTAVRRQASLAALRLALCINK